MRRMLSVKTLDDQKSKMQLVSSRTISFIDVPSLAVCEAKEALLHDQSGGFILYLSGAGSSSTMEERVFFLELREALVWLNEPPEDQGSFWV
ncbi:hypothetical protein ACVW1A_004824 [Bradyrhizobium sp. LB1.3]|jgi:hypothetical protein